MLRHLLNNALVPCILRKSRKLPSDKSEVLVLPDRIVVQHLEVQDATQTAEQNKLGLLPVRVPGVLLPVSVLERGVVVDGEGDVRVGISTAKFVALDTLRRDDRNLEYADGRVEWNAGHELFEV